MTKTGIHLGDIHSGTSLQQPKSQTTAEKDPFHILVLADFSGHNDSLGKITQVDRDNFDEILAKINPQINLPIQDTVDNRVKLEFSELEDFEPDAIYEKLEIFAQLRSLRRRLSNTSTFSDAASEMQNWGVEHQSTQQQGTTETAPISGDVLDVLLSETEKRTTNVADMSGSELARNLIKEIVAPHIIPAPDPKQPEMISAVDESISDQMSSLLHHPEFQQLEASWRALYILVRRIQTDSDLKIFIKDVNKNHLINSMDSEAPQSTTFFRECIEPYCQVTGGKPWSVILGDYQFTDAVEDIQLLKYLSVYAAQTNATFVAGADCELVGCGSQANSSDAEDWQLNWSDETQANWQSLRDMPHSRHLALTFPKFLLRLPYGEKSRAIESFDYEEMPYDIHEHYLWGNAAYAWTCLLAQSYSQEKWQFRPGEYNEVGNLPVHAMDVDGENELKPCAEILLTEKAAEKLTDLGITPCWSVKNQDSIRIGPFISMNSTPQIVAGRWNT